MITSQYRVTVYKIKSVRKRREHNPRTWTRLFSFIGTRTFDPFCYNSYMKEKIFFENINGKKIFCYLSEPTSSQKKIVIMCHGFRGSSLGSAKQFVDFARLLDQKGFSTLRFDQPNSGNSDGDFLNSSFNEWVDALVFFIKKYLDQGYKVSLLGQSMGATAAVISTSKPGVKDKIPCILLWVPDPKSDVEIDFNQAYEEGGQKYKGSFWKEAKNGDFLKCLDQYQGKIHLVYGAQDKFISQKLRNQVIEKVKSKGGKVMILEGQDHSPWGFELTQQVYKEELDILNQI